MYQASRNALRLSIGLIAAAAAQQKRTGMSPNLTFAPQQRSHDLLTEQVLDHPAITYDVGEGGVVIAVKGELIVSRSARSDSPRLDLELRRIAQPTGTLASTELAPGHQRSRVADLEIKDPDPNGPAADIELWRLDDPKHDSIDQARRLAAIARKVHPTFSGIPQPELPAVSPNHACVVAPSFHHCPYGPPYAAPAPAPGFLTPYVPPTARVVVVDTGYIPLNSDLDARVTRVQGEMWDVYAAPPAWVPDPPDGTGNRDAAGRLLEIVGHGTFIAGQIAHAAPQVAITAVGQLDNPAFLDPSGGGNAYPLFASEFSVAHSMLLYGTGDVILCGFAFPTLDDHPSLPIKAALDAVTAPRPGIAIVAPAGNSESAIPQWPAAFGEVIGVAASDRRERARARFSNWGHWLDCCARGEYVLSTYIDYSGPMEGDPLAAFNGWARWQGTSFAAPKVAAAIAAAVAADPGLEPLDAYENLITGGGGVDVDWITDHHVTPGVSLPQLKLG
jgi:Subtilase family